MKTIFFALSLSFVAIANPVAAEEPKLTYSKAAKEAQRVGDAYFSAYIARDWDAIEPLMADRNSFQDATAELVFGSVKQDGKANVMKLFREGYAGITHMKFLPQRKLHAGHYAIYQGSLAWGLDLGGGRIVDSKMPFTVILRIEAGQVVEHRDYADYAPFLKSMKDSPKPQ